MNQVIHLEKVTYDNVRAILKLRVARAQKSFVAGNDWSLVQAYLSLSQGEPVFPFAICRGEKPVGFIMISHGSDWSGYKRPAWLNSELFRQYQGKHYYYIWRFMIDKKYQRRGYGREALRLALDFIRSHPCGEAEYCVLSYEPENEVAKQLYRSFGFEEISGEGFYEAGDEVDAVLKL